MDSVEMIWVQVCYFVEFKKTEENKWTWDYIGNGEENVDILYVPSSISYIELYNKVQELVNVDSKLYEIEMMSLNPGMSKFSVPPQRINSDMKVKWFLSICKKHPLCVTISTKVTGECDSVREFERDCGVETNGEVEKGDVSHQNEVELYDGDHGNDNVEEGNSVDWDNLHIIQGSSEQQDFEDKSPPRNENNVDFSMEEDIIGTSTQVLCSIPYRSSVRIPENEDVHDDELFPTKSALISKLQLLAVKYQFEFKVKKSNKSVYTVVCVEKICNWRLRATSIAESEIFQIRKYSSHHICSMSVRRRDNRHATYSVIGKHVAPKYHDANIVYRPRNIINDVRREFGITIKYHKAYMAKEFAYKEVRGSPDDSYAKLPMYCHILEKNNPGTLTFIETDNDGHFMYFFMALGPSIRGFLSSIRRVICVDGTFLKSKYRGTLLVATCQDANRQIYPLAWGIVDSENNDSWTWFFQKLRQITDDTDELVFISDRATSISNGFNSVYLNAHHGHCIWHLQTNLKSKFPRIDIVPLFRATAQAYSLAKFEINMQALCSLHEKIREYLEEEVGVEYWSRAHFNGIRYNTMTTNNAESLNSLLRSAREFPILALIEYIREKMQSWFHDRRIDAEKCTSYLTPPMEEKMYDRYNESKGFEVKALSPDEMQVSDKMESFIVNLERGTCTCKEFDLDQFPCAHAIAVVRDVGDNCYRFCSPFYSTSYWKQAYSEYIYPLSNEVDWEIPDSVRSRKVIRPLTRRGSGHPPKKKETISRRGAQVS
ncbi:uncharacterized protein LOC111377032 [Olea europaea var. sylvestris]|uniref:uncharacterized protein LOC111377032 n=1 Tax=Olea europaea var. sylvestris TaxID=158386 RepID=UPI000C1D7CFB|nr:uncharacterized protein LOC111377032 [Olea europaea var. sylvestris]